MAVAGYTHMKTPTGRNLVKRQALALHIVIALTFGDMVLMDGPGCMSWRMKPVSKRYDSPRLEIN